MTKKKSFISLVLAFCLIIPAMFLLSACGGNNTQTLKSDDGIAVVGEFEKGAELKTDKVEISSDDATTIFDKLESGNIVITSTDNAMIYDIFVSKDDQKVQPNGKVAVSVPVTESANGYKVFHIKDDNTIEELSATYKDGILTFETSSFSYFVIVPAGDVSMNTDPSDPTPDTPTAETIWTNAINTWEQADNVKVVERISSPSYPDDSGAQIMIYQLVGTAYNEDGYFENAEESNGKGKGYYIVKETDGYVRYESYEEDGSWYKTLAGDMTNQLKRTIYGCLDLEDGLIDFSFSNFNYDASTDTYKYKANENITVKLEFVNGNIDKIIITRLRVSDNTTMARTITFGDAVVDVPTTNINDQTASE